MRSLSARVPPAAGQRWTPEQAEALIGLRAELAVAPFGPLEGEVVAATVLDDEMGHALWLTVTRSDEGDDVVAAGVLGAVSLAAPARLVRLDAEGRPTGDVIEIGPAGLTMERP